MKGYREVMLLFVVLVACTSSPNKHSPQDEETYPEENKSSEQPKGEIHVIEIKQMKFQPGEIKVHKGDEVRWVNRDITDHDVTDQKKEWASSRLPNGKSWSMVVTKSTDYYCNLHQVMKGKIIVE